MPANLSELAATTLEYYEPSLQDNIFKKHALLDHLKENGGTKIIDGGRKIRVPLMHATSSSGSYFSGMDELDLSYQDAVDAAEYDWRFFNQSIVFTKTDEMKNRGKSQVISLLKAKIKQAENSIRETLAGDVVDGTAASGEVSGLDEVIGTGTYGSIAGATYTWWNSTVDSTSETLSISDMRNAKNSANNGNGGSNVSIIVTTQTLFEKYHGLLTSTYQMNQPAPTAESKRIADAGFTSTEFEGVPIIYDEQATSGSMYFINVDNFKLYMLEGGDFKMEDANSPANQHIMVKHIVFAGNTGTDRRASLAKLTNKTA
jgi:hypothetical protein